jgi:hypothetical protein
MCGLPSVLAVRNKNKSLSKKLKMVTKVNEYCKNYYIITIASRLEESDSRQGKHLFLFSTASRQTPGPISLLSSDYGRPYPLGIRRLELGADHSHTFSAEVKNGGVIAFTPHISLWYSS